VRVVHDLRYMFFVVRSNDSFNFPLGLISYIVIVVIFRHADRQADRDRQTLRQTERDSDID